MYLRKYRAGTAAFIETPRFQPEPRTLPLPEPELRYMRLVEPPFLSDERAAALSNSQQKAIALIEEGNLEAAVLTLKVGTWRNPEEELRQLIIYVRCGGISTHGFDDDELPIISGKEEP